jgi:hypothetical protein
VRLGVKSGGCGGLEVGDVVDICFGLGNRRDFECLEDRGDLGVATDVGLGMEVCDSLDDVGDSS